MKCEDHLRNHSGIGPSAFDDTDYIFVRGSIVGCLTPNIKNYLIFSYIMSDTNGAVPRL